MRTAQLRRCGVRCVSSLAGGVTLKRPNLKSSAGLPPEPGAVTDMNEYSCREWHGASMNRLSGFAGHTMGCVPTRDLVSKVQLFGPHRLPSLPWLDAPGVHRPALWLMSHAESGLTVGARTSTSQGRNPFSLRTMGCITTSGVWPCLPLRQCVQSPMHEQGSKQECAARQNDAPEEYHQPG